MAGEIIFYGATVERSSDSGTTWVSIPDVTEFSIPEQSTERAEITSLDTADGVRTYIAGLTDLGEWTFAQNYTRAGYTQLEADRGVSMQYRITLKSPDGGTTTGDVLLITSAQRTGSVDTSALGEAVGITNTLTLGAAPAWTAGS